MSVDPFGFNLYYKAASAVLGEGTKVWNFATVEDNVVTGRDCVIGSNAWIGRGTIMGDNVRVQHGVFIARNSVLGSDIFLGPYAILCDDARPKAGNTAYKAEPPVLEDGCSLGAGCIILPGVRIGKGATVGAGAIVTKDVEPNTLVVGNPARAVAHNLQGAS